MKKLLSALIASTALSGAAIAGNLDTPAPEAAIVDPSVAAAVIDWSGFYAGAMASFESGEYSRFEDGVYASGPFVFEAGNMFGGFAGYNIQNGSMVYGAEVSASTGAIGVEGFPTWNYDYLIDANARVGIAFGRALAYATAGYTTSTWNNNIQGPFPMSGFNYGAGIDLMVTNRIFVGAKYVFHDLSADMTAFDDVSTTEQDLQSITVRVGVNF